MEKIIDIYPDFGGCWNLVKVYRDKDGVKHREEIKNWNDYIYATEEKLNEMKNIEEINKQIVKTELVTNKKPLFCDKDVYKIYLKGIWSKFKIRKYFKDLNEIFEADVPAEIRYTVDNISEIEKVNYKILYFDIETTTDNGFPDYENAIEKITCITMYDNYKKKFLTYLLNPNTNQDIITEYGEDKKVAIFNDEKEMLSSFINLVNKEDYDILTAWNISFDLSYIFGRCNYFNISYQELSPYKNIKINKRMNKQQREELEINISGRFVIDLLLRYKAITFKEISSYSLEFVSELEFGKEEKKRKVLNFSEEWLVHTNDLVKYNIKDVELLVNLDNKLKLIDYLEELRLINYLPNIQYSATAKHIIDMALFREFSDKIIFPSRGNLEKKKFGGGYVKNPKYGIYENVATYDFSGLYPSLIRTFNLSKDTIVPVEEADFITYEDDVDELPQDIERLGYRTGWTLSHRGLIPIILEKIINLRMSIKKEMKLLDKDSIEYREKNLKQYALKAPINANYGVNAYNGFRLYEPRVAATITYLGRRLNKYCSKRIEEDYNLPVIYNDTDSFFVCFDDKLDNDKIIQIKDSINNKYVIEFIKEISNGKITENFINVEQENIFEKLLLIKKRRYLGRLKNGEWIYKGVDLKRSNTPKIIKEILEEYILKNFNNDNENLLALTRMLHDSQNDIDKFKIPLKLSKEYDTDLPQKRAASWANTHLKSNFKQGSKFYGLWVNTPETDIIGFSSIDELKDIKNFKLDLKKYEQILIDKLNNLRPEDKEIKDIYQTKLF